MQLARHLVVSALLLTSSSTLAEEELTESDKPQTFAFKCTVPTTGTARCGDADRNISLGRGKRLQIQVKTITPPDDPPNPEDPIKLDFVVYHAVSGDELRKLTKVEAFTNPVALWANPNDKPVDVFVKVGSNRYRELTITGSYIVERP